MKDLRAMEAAELLGFGNAWEEVAAFARSYAERKGDYPQWEREQAARHLLWSEGHHKFGFEPGGFHRTLLIAWGRADNVNKGRLAIGFPVYGDATGVYATKGIEGLLDWAGIQA